MDLFDCSILQLNSLCQKRESFGSLGSRLTSARCGRRTTHSVPLEQMEQVSNVIEGLEMEYYRKNFKDMSSEDIKKRICCHSF